MPLHMPSGQTGGHVPQSCAQREHVSAPLQAASPHTGGHTPQSCVQVEQDSPALQMPFPHTAPVTVKVKRVYTVGSPRLFWVQIQWALLEMPLIGPWIVVPFCPNDVAGDQ